MLTLAFDGICFLGGRWTGVARAFATGLAAYAAARRADCVLLLPEGSEDPQLPGVRIAPAPAGRWQRQRHLPALLRAVGAALLHSPVAAVPLRARCPTIATVHDLPWLHAEVGERSSPWRRWATAKSLRSAALVLAPSTMTQRDAGSLLADPGKVRLVPHATLLPSPGGSETARQGPLLVLGDNRPRKNRTRLAAAHTLAKQRRPTLPALRFLGPPDSYVDEPTKAQLLQQCRALVHVSRFEGFGLPVLEGLAFGAPVLCSDLAPHREIAAGDAVYVAADDTLAIVEGLLRIDGDLALRAQLSAAGPRRAARFAPEVVAARWADLHQELLA